MTDGHGNSLSTFPWWFLHFVNKRIKSEMMLLSSLLRNFALAALIQERLLFERRTQRGVSDLCSLCSLFFPEFAVLGTFSYFCGGFGNGAATEFAADVGGIYLWCCVCVFIPEELYVLSVILRKNRKCENAWSSTVDCERVWPRSRTLLWIVWRRNSNRFCSKRG